MKINGKEVEKAFQDGVREALRKHALMGNPVYYTHEDGLEIFEALLDPVTLEPIWERVVCIEKKE
ncbi:MAG: hypothetical protein WC906_00450 [Parcubacteria group bacterium]|jgi:hypothetical protein